MLRSHLLAVALCVIASQAGADRHCGPVLDSYYHARQAALEQETSCNAAFQTALQRISEMHANARICGCTSLADGLDTAFSEILEKHVGWEDRRAAILDSALDARIKAWVQDCH